MSENTRTDRPYSDPLAPKSEGWLAGKTVVALESRFPKEFAGLIERRGGRVVSAPSLREIPDPHAPSVHRYIEGVVEGVYGMVVLLTGVGTRLCIETSSEIGLENEFLLGLASTTTICRGPKPVAVLRKHGIEPTEMAPEPHTSEQLANVLRRRGSEIAGREVALQHYGSDNAFIRQELRSLGAKVFDVYPYTWGLPENIGPLQEAVRLIASHEVDAVCFTSRPQVKNLLEVARSMGLLAEVKEAFAGSVVPAAVGPVAAASLFEEEILPKVEPNRPKMADLVRALDSLSDPN
ncbi:MAG: hypothetical protein C4319_00970 [Acidimicrobiia bacterium]